MRPVAVVTFGALLGLLPRAADALTLVEEDKLKLDMFGYVRAGYVVQKDGPVTSHGTYLGLARLAARGTWDKYGSAFVQIAGDRGTISILDAIAELRPHESVSIEIGKMRTPTSADLMIAGPFTPFVNRSLLFTGGYAEGRLIGAQVIGRAGDDPVNGQVQLGVFEPGAAMLTQPNAKFLSVRALVETSMGLSFHVAYMDLIHDQPTPILLDQRLDVAAYYKNDGWTIYFEGATAFDSPFDLPIAAYVYVLKSFPLPGTEFDLQPGLRYDIDHRSGGNADTTRHRVTVGVNLFVFADHLNATLNYELSVRTGDAAHAAYAQLQAGF